MHDLDKDDLVLMANEINEYVQEFQYAHSEVGVKELKKMEMYLRKAFIMYRAFTEIRDPDLPTPADDVWLNAMHNALIKDQRYVKMRDGLDDYKI